MGSIGILVVDDHDQFVTVVQAVLGSEQGLEVVATAENGERAVEVARERQPDVVLMDISMPVLDGFEATRAILAERPSSRVVMLTGSGSDEDRARARAVGAVAYVQKERILEELVPTIRAAHEGAELS